ncbi:MULTISPECIES: SDR family NAD(P)-dependent oxidoreductase [Natrialbaceae]|uniref:SDR family NAD(P)-dependent oxidoreductase n=1 Tax=Natrialbaceae TaxID=1644061 RepID=UPI00207C314A|nr:SDR family NAD(P)-dependent oxidoreductase [Natronococcus sp. CG52]
MIGSTTYEYRGESAIVTGPTRGIGYGIVKAFAEANADVVVNSRTESDVEVTAAELDKIGDGDVIGIAADLSQPEEIPTTVTVLPLSSRAGKRRHSLLC